MTLTNRKKRLRKKYRRFHAKNNITICKNKGCNKPLWNYTHHLYCNKCWHEINNK